MKTFLLIVVVFWIGMGMGILKIEMEKGNKKLLNVKGAKAFAKILLLSVLYGPRTRSKVLAKL